MKVRSLVVSGFGVNCEREIALAYRLAGADSVIVHFNELLSGKVDLDDFHVLNFPGGFSFGDDLGAGKAFANKILHSKVSGGGRFVDRLVGFVGGGKYVFGVCNGFQILVEAGLLPGALIRNDTLRFSCKWVNLRVETNRSAATSLPSKELFWRIPIAHGEGRYFNDEQGLKELNDNDQIVWRYVDENNQITQAANPNGSIENIAGICNLEGNVVGLMPHPERASESILSPWGSDHGKLYFKSIENFIRSRK